MEGNKPQQSEVPNVDNFQNALDYANQHPEGVDHPSVPEWVREEMKRRLAWIGQVSNLFKKK